MNRTLSTPGLINGLTFRGYEIRLSRDIEYVAHEPVHVRIYKGRKVIESVRGTLNGALNKAWANMEGRVDE